MTEEKESLSSTQNYLELVHYLWLQTIITGKTVDEVIAENEQKIQDFEKQLLGNPREKQIPYVAIGNGEPVPEHLKHLIQEVPSVRDDPEIGREQERNIQMGYDTDYPLIICLDCGTAALAQPENSHKVRMRVSTWYKFTCECCKEKKSCTESRDFGYPDFRNVKP